VSVVYNIITMFTHVTTSNYLEVSDNITVKMAMNHLYAVGYSLQNILPLEVEQEATEYESGVNVLASMF
jgi:hypothetical protein